MDRLKGWSAEAYFAGRFLKSERGCQKWWLLLGGRAPSPKTETVDVDGCPTRARKVTKRWMDRMLAKSESPLTAYHFLVQVVSDGAIREIFPEVWFAHQHREARRRYRREKALGTLVTVNPYRTRSIRACAKESIV